MPEDNDNKITPLYPMILCRPVYEEMSSKVIIPDILKKEPQKAVVVKLSEGITEVSVGDEIYFKDLAGTYIDDLLLIPITDVLLRFVE